MIFRGWDRIGEVEACVRLGIRGCGGVRHENPRERFVAVDVWIEERGRRIGRVSQDAYGGLEIRDVRTGETVRASREEARRRFGEKGEEAYERIVRYNQRQSAVFRE